MTLDPGMENYLRKYRELINLLTELISLVNQKVCTSV